ncbi:MAG TPA: hypothetical protein PLV13_05095 [Ilumatobacteraceae bacterium]|nr:hypothetical protein [Ilumatobacteraceae bacterium]
MILSFATDGVAPDQYDSGNRAAGFFFAILISMLVSGVGAGVYGTVWCSWCRIRTAVLWGLVPAGVALAVVPILWNS